MTELIGFFLYSFWMCHKFQKVADCTAPIPIRQGETVIGSGTQTKYMISTLKWNKILFIIIFIWIMKCNKSTNGSFDNINLVSYVSMTRTLLKFIKCRYKLNYSAGTTNAYLILYFNWFDVKLNNFNMYNEKLFSVTVILFLALVFLFSISLT